MAFDNLKKKKYTAITSSIKTKNKSIYRKIPSVLRLGKKEKTNGGFFNYDKILSASDKSIGSEDYQENAVVVFQDVDTFETYTGLTASLFRANMNDYLQNTSGFSNDAYLQLSSSFFKQIGDATINMPRGEAYVGILASPFEEGSNRTGTGIIPPITASLSILEAPGIAFDSASQIRTRKITYFNSSSNFTNSHFFFNYLSANSSTTKFGDTEQSASTAALVTAGRSHLTRSFTSIFTSPKSQDMFYYVQSKPITKWSVEMTSSAATSSFYALTSSFSSSADFGAVSGGIANPNAFIGNVYETGSAIPKFYNGVDDSDGKWLYVVQKAVIEGEGENSLGESNYGGNVGTNFAFTPQQLVVWYPPDYYYSNVRSASYYFTPYPTNMHELDNGAKTRDLVTGSISSSEAIGTGELRTLYWLNHTYTSSFTGSFGHFNRDTLRNRTGNANFHQLPYMNTSINYFGRKARTANSSHLWKDKYLSKPADEGYYVHSSSFSVNSKNQISSSLGSPNHTSSFFVMGVFKHPFIPGIDGNIMNYSSSQNREPGISATSWVNHHTIASCIFLKKYDDTVFIFHPSASGFVTSESVG